MLRGSCVFGCLLAMLTLFSATAGGQQISCSASTASPPSVRSGGLTELLSDVIIDCTGGPPGVTFITWSFMLNVVPTPRFVFDSRLSDALLVIDDPVNPVLGQYGQAGGNVFVGNRPHYNDIVWENIPYTNPPPGGRRRIRFKNIRGNTTDILWGGADAIVASVTGRASASIQIQNPDNLKLGSILPAMVSSVRDGRDRSAPLGPWGVVLEPGTTAPGAPAAYLRFTEGFQGAFRHRGESDPNPVATSSADYGSESGYKFALGSGTVAGLADFGTRMVASFADIPRGVHVWVALHDTTGWARLTVREDAAFQAVPSTAVFGNDHVAEIPLSAGTGTAVWELLVHPATKTTFDIPIFLTSDRDMTDGLGKVLGRLGPNYGLPPGIVNPIPRFGRAGTPVPLVTARNVTPVNPVVVACNPAAGPSAVGTPYSIACSASGGQPPYQWSISSGTLPAGFTLNPAGATATISGTPTATGAYQFNVTVQDSSVPAVRASQTYSGTISSSPTPQLTVTCIPAAGPTTAGMPYLTTCTASGGQSAYHWSIANGTLPAGLTLTASWGGITATVSGTPIAAGAYSFSVTVQDSSSPPGRAGQAFSGTIGPPGPSITITCVPSSGPTVAGTRYSTTCTAANGVAPLRWSISAGALPAGLTLSLTTGDTVSISGSPPAGNYGFTVTVTDSGGRSASQSFAGTVIANLTVACVPDNGPTAVGTAYSTSCRAEGGTAPYTWSIRAGRLPEGLALSATTGATVTISGTPATAGNYSFLVGVTDASNPPQSGSWLFTGTLPVPFKTFNAAGFLEGTIAPDSIASLYGTGLALRTESSDGTATTNLGGASVKVIDSSGVGRDARLFYASEGQINFLVPRETAAGAASIRVTKTGVPVGLSGDPVGVAGVAPGIFVVSGGSKVPAAFFLRVTPAGQRIQNYTFDAMLAGVEIPRETGDEIYLLLYGTGFRGCAGRARATANGQAVPVLGAVAQLEFAGLDQVNIGPLPASLPSGIVTVRLEFDGIPANDITVRLQ